MDAILPCALVTRSGRTLIRAIGHSIGDLASISGRCPAGQFILRGVGDHSRHLTASSVLALVGAPDPKPPGTLTTGGRSATRLLLWSLKSIRTSNEMSHFLELLSQVYTAASRFSPVLPRESQLYARSPSKSRRRIGRRPELCRPSNFADCSRRFDSCLRFASKPNPRTFRFTLRMVCIISDSLW